jgi:hypothetical protein
MGTQNQEIPPDVCQRRLEVSGMLLRPINGSGSPRETPAITDETVG